MPLGHLSLHKRALDYGKSPNDFSCALLYNALKEGKYAKLVFPNGKGATYDI